MGSLPPGQGDVVVVGVIFARLNVEAMLPTLSEAIEEWRPDVIVREAAEFASAAAAELHGLPHVRVAVGMAQVEEFALALSAPALEDRRFGLVAQIAESPYLTCYPASVDPAPFEVARFRDPGVLEQDSYRNSARRSRTRCASYRRSTTSSSSCRRNAAVTSNRSRKDSYGTPCSSR